MGIILAVILLSIIVIFHEFGHFLLARQNGIIVDEFAIGLGPKLFGIKGKQTTFAVKMLPFGGSCMMRGEDGLDAEIEEGSFNSRSVWARMTVILAGPVFNFILAFIFAVIIIGYTGYRDCTLSDVEAGSPAAEAGLRAGDTITAIDSKQVHLFKELSLYMYFYPGKTYNVTYERDGVKNKVAITPFYDEELATYRIGIISNPNQKADFGRMLKYGFYELGYNVWSVVRSLSMLVTGQLGRDDIAGPVGVVTIVDESYQASKSYGFLSVFMTMAQLIVILSANLGVMNLLPIPALDGGRFLFLLVEAVRGKPLNKEREGIVNLVGFGLLMALMVFVMFNDITRLFR